MAETVYQVDPNHSGLRLAVMGSIGVGFLLGVVGGPLVFINLGLANFAVLGGIIAGVTLAASFAWLAEHNLRAVWPSGREIAVMDDAVALRHRRAEESAVIRWAEPVDVLAWKFVIMGRRAWVQRGWYVVAVRLAQGDAVIIPYAFMSPEDVSALPCAEAFVELVPRRDQDAHPAEFEAQEPLREADAERWEMGSEMQPEDFRELMAVLVERIDGWPERCE